MPTVRLGIAGGIWCLMAVAAAAARGEERPLLVTVEVGPGGGVAASQVRQVIGDELNRPVLALGDASRAPADEAEDLLLVEIDRGRIVVSMRRYTEEIVAREVPAPPDKAARLRVVAWLAGNLARDQVTPLLASSANLEAPAAEMAGDPAPAPRSETEPAPVAPPALPDLKPAVRVETKAPVRQEVERDWSVLLSGGLAEPANALANRVSRFDTTYWQLEVARHRPDRWLWGFGLDYGPSVGLGVFALGGVERRWGGWRLDGAVGLGGMSASITSTTTTTSTEPSAMGTRETSVTRSGNPVPYVRVFGTLARQLTPSWDVVLRVGVVNGIFGGTELASSLGVRLNLP